MCRLDGACDSAVTDGKTAPITQRIIDIGKVISLLIIVIVKLKIV